MSLFVDHARTYLGQGWSFFGQTRRSKSMSRRLASRPDQLPELAGMNDLQGRAYTQQSVRAWKATASPEQVAEFERQRQEAATAFGRNGFGLPYWDLLWILRTYQRSLSSNVGQSHRPLEAPAETRSNMMASFGSAAGQWKLGLADLLKPFAGSAVPETDGRAPAGRRVVALALTVAAVILLSLTATLILQRSVRAVPDPGFVATSPPRSARSSVPPPPARNLAPDRALASQSASQSARPVSTLPPPASAERGQPMLPRTTGPATASVHRPDQAGRADVASDDAKPWRSKPWRSKGWHATAPGSRPVIGRPAGPARSVLAAPLPSAHEVIAPGASRKAEVSGNSPHERSLAMADVPVGATAMMAVAPAPDDTLPESTARAPMREASGRPQQHPPAHRELDGIDAIRLLRRQ